MEKPTTGQRIAQCRKSMGLSQEDLGEKVGVSRQAISKWEADATLPEIDKLIALSRLFDLSVGWLLGVEEQPEPQAAGSQISEELLQKIEQIVRSNQPEKRRHAGIKILLAAATSLLLILGASALRGELAETQGQVAALSTQLQSDIRQNSSILSRLDQLEDRLGELAATPERFSVADWSYQIEPDSENARARLLLTAIPGFWQADYEAVLSVRREGQQVVSQACAWDGNALTAQLVLPLENGYEYWLTAKYADGTQEQVELPNSTARNLKSSFTIGCQTVVGEARFDLKKGTMELSGHEIHLSRPDLPSGYDADWAKVELILYHTRGSSCQIVYTEALFEPENIKEDQAAGQLSEICNFTFFLNGPYPIPELEDGDGLELWICAEMDNGISLMQLVDSWEYLNGEFIGGEPVE